MNKRIILGVMGLVLAAGMFACSKSETAPTKEKAAKPASAKTITDTTNAFSINIPGDWEVKQNQPNGPALQAFSARADPSDYRESISIIAMALPEGFDTDTLSQRVLDNMKKDIPDLTVESRKKATLGTLPAQEAIYNFTMANTNIKVKAYFIVQGKHGYIITCEALKDTYNASIGWLDKVATTFKAIAANN